MSDEKVDTPYDRRSLLQCQTNPNSSLDYVTKIAGVIYNSDNDHPYAIVLHYVPDRLVLTPESLSVYFKELGTGQLDSLENLVTTILDDLQNELVPRWVRVQATLTLAINEPVEQQSTTAEDGQPGWQNDAVLLRLTT